MFHVNIDNMENKKTWFSSDWHLGHGNIIKYDNRPFKSVDEMNQTIIDNYNSLVAEGDDFYFLGDLAFMNNWKEIDEILKSLKGNLFFIKGNHDSSDIRKLYSKNGTYLGELAEIKVNEQQIVLCHYAMRVWNKSHRGVWHLYGHSHHSLSDDKNSLSIDVGINGPNYNYSPIEFNTIKQIMSTKDFKPIDHHENPRHLKK